MAAHELRLEYLETVARRTSWGWKASCSCGWRNPAPFWGTKKRERRAYYRHRDAV